MDGETDCLKESIEHHVEEEEGEMFEQAKNVLKEGESEHIGKMFIEGKKTFLEGMKM